MHSLLHVVSEDPEDGIEVVLAQDLSVGVVKLSAVTGGI